MDRLSYTALSGMRAAMSAQSVTANNVANATTTGFRRDFSEQIAVGLGPAPLPARVQTNAQRGQADLAPGAMVQTGRALDIGLSGGSYLVVQPAEGGEALTRRGDLRITADGLLLTGGGHPVQGERGPVSLPPAARVEIGSDGTISIQPEGARASELSAVDRLKLARPDESTLTKRADGLLAVPGKDIAADPAARLTTGQLESSNVNLAAEMVTLIEQARAFELNVGLITTARDLDQSGAALLRHER